MTSVYDFKAKSLMGRDVALSDYRGEVMLIVNTASKCGFTPQYKGLEQLFRDFGERGFSVLGFPCNQFGKQEPGENEQIGQFCSLTYGVTFPLFAKIDVNGPTAHPLYKYLKSEQAGFLGLRSIKWNFTKFLVDRSGTVKGRFPPTTTPAALASHIRTSL